jgi:hypothetical protein
MWCHYKTRKILFSPPTPPRLFFRPRIFIFALEKKTSERVFWNFPSSNIIFNGNKVLKNVFRSFYVRAKMKIQKGKKNNKHHKIFFYHFPYPLASSWIFKNILFSSRTRMYILQHVLEFKHSLYIYEILEFYIFKF